MKKILEIFKNDLKKIKKSKMAIIILVGIIIIPGIYAWLNIDSNWGPYDNTGNIPIAVVNNDTGTTILGEKVNVGKEMEESLKNNKGMKWIFTNEKKAKLNVKKGKYYGAIIIPKDFSQRITTIMKEDKLEKPTFDFYVNNKKNPIAPIIVNKAVGTIQTSVNQSFVNTVLYKIVGKADSLDVIAKSSDKTEELINKLNSSKVKIEELRKFIRMTDNAAQTTSKSLAAIRKLLPTMSDISTTTKEGINDMKNAAKSFDETYDNLEKDISSIISEADGTIKDTLDMLNQTDPTNIVDNFKKASDRFNKVESILKRLETTLDSITKVANLSGVQALKDRVSKQITKIENIQTLLKDTNNAITNLETVKHDVNDLYSDITSFKQKYNGEVKKEISDLYKGASKSLSGVTNAMLNLNVSLDNVDAAMGYMISAFESGGRLSGDIDGILVNFEEDIDKVNAAIREAKSSELYNNLINILKNDPKEVADFLSTPVDTNQIELYSINTYGSKMTPFYSVLACWVGCTLLTSILKIGVEDKKVLKGAKHYQKFFGRFMLFGIMAMLQGLMIGLGDLFLQVQTVNWFLFLLTLMLSSLTFVLIIYSLTFVFGKIGQALSIVIMVLQVAGSGGTFPIELLPRLFQILQPFMPFYPAMNAARETIGGFYGLDYLIYIFILLSHMIIPLVLGLWLGKHTIKTKEKVEKELEKTGVIG